jgi:hypothetical protein
MSLPEARKTMTSPIPSSRITYRRRQNRLVRVEKMHQMALNVPHLAQETSP